VEVAKDPKIKEHLFDANILGAIQTEWLFFDKNLDRKKYKHI
jgi:hypothetical protein